MSRWVPWLSELQPELFCEVSPELAAERGLEHGGWATVKTARAEVECRVIVTRRARPLVVSGEVIHQIAMPYHFGSVGYVTGDVVNNLFELVSDQNVHIPESKVATCTIRPGRRHKELMRIDPDPGRDALLARDMPGVGQPTPQPMQNKTEK
jgi:formate dehydrogenase major subunit